MRSDARQLSTAFPLLVIVPFVMWTADVRIQTEANVTRLRSLRVVLTALRRLNGRDGE
jgi:hypothetical protein